MMNANSGRQLSALLKVVSACETITFQLAAIRRAVDESEPGELADSDRRHIKGTPVRLAEEAESLFNWAIAVFRNRAVN